MTPFYTIYPPKMLCKRVEFHTENQKGHPLDAWSNKNFKPQIAVL